MKLWIHWWKCVAQLRPACTRNATFLWMATALLAMSIRPELAGVTSLVRAVWLPDAAYQSLLNLFHSSGLDIEALTELWIRLALRLFTPLRVNGSVVAVIDGLKVPKEGRKMPAVKSLHQESTNNTKPEFISGHSFQALGLLVRGPLGQLFSVLLMSRIHEGLVFSNRDKRSLLDKMVQMFLPAAGSLNGPVVLVADAYYASKKVIVPLLDKGHHLVTRVKSNAVAWCPAPQPQRRVPGRPRMYGDKVVLRELWSRTDLFSCAPSPVYGDNNVELRYYCVDLLWRPVGRRVRFVLVHHPLRGKVILMSTDTSLSPLDIISTYGYRFKIEVAFKQALRTLGTYAYHFWMQDMTPRKRRSGNQHLHHKTEEYRRLVRRKMDAYHRFVQLGCIAQGLLQYLSLSFRKQVWKDFARASWMRTMNISRPPSEAVVSHALRVSLPEFLACTDDEHPLKKLLFEKADLERCRELQLIA